MNKKIGAMIMGILMSVTATATAFAAATPEKNPFGLVYRGAITEHAKGKVNIHPVTYTLNGLKIAANVYTPAGYAPDKKYPAVVVAHPNGGVKEQVAGLYAQHLTENGYITIAADASYQGTSEGTPSNVDKPHYRTNDIQGMAYFILTYPGGYPAPWRARHLRRRWIYLECD